MKNKYKDVKKIIDYVSDIESTCDEYIIKTNNLCILTSRLLKSSRSTRNSGFNGRPCRCRSKTYEIDNNLKTVH